MVDSGRLNQLDQEVIFRALAKNAADGIAVVGPGGRLAFANRACYDRFGYDYGDREMVGLRVVDLWPEGETTPWDEDILPQVAAGDWQGRVHQKRKDGSLFEAQLTVFSISDGKEQPAHLAMLLRPINGRESTLERVADLERELILDSVSEHVIYQDLEHRIIWSNRAANESVGAKRQELKGHYCYEIWPQRGDRCPDCPVADAMAAGRPQQTEKQTPDGRYWFVRGYPVKDNEGNVIGGIEVTQEITDRKKVEAELREREVLFRSVVESSPTGIFIVGENYQFVYANDELSHMLGYSPEEISGLDFREVLDEESKQSVADRYIRRQRGEEVPSRYEIKVVRKDGKRRQLEMSAILIRDSAGNPQTVAQVVDITERKQAQRRHQELLARRGQQVQISTEIAQEIAAAPALSELFRRMVTLIKERFGYYHVQIFRYDPAVDAMRVVEGYGDIGNKMRAAGHSLPYGEGVVGTAAAIGEPVLASDVAEDPYWVPHPDLPDTKGELAVPIKWQNQVLGILDVQSDEAGALTEEDQVVLLGLAGQAASAIESTNLLDEAQKSEQRYRSYIDNAPDGIFIANDKGQYLEVNDAACRITGYSREELLSMTIPDLVSPRSIEAAETHFAQLYEIGRASGEFSFIRKDGSEGYWSVEAVKLSETRLLGFVKDITERKRAERMLSDRVKELNFLTVVGQKISEEPPISALLNWVAKRIPSAMQYPEECVAAIEFEDTLYGQPEAVDLPCQIVAGLRVGGERIGQIYVAYAEEHDFLDEESAMLGGILRRLESYVERRQAARQLEHRARQMEAVAEIAGATGIILDPDELIQKAVNLVRDRFDLYYVGLFMLDESGEWAVLRTGTGEAGRQMVEDGHRLAVGGDSMIGWCIAHQEARIALDVGKEAVRFENPHLPETRSELAIPLVARGDIIGAMTVQSTRKAAFSEDDITVFQTMVDQVATAIENARLFEQTQETLAQTESLYRGSSQVTQAQTLDDILHALVQSTALQRLDRANFLLFDHPLLPGEHPDAFTVKAVWERSGGEPRAPIGTRYDFDQFPAGRIVDRHRPTIVGDVATDKRIDESTRGLILKRLGSRSIVFWPLVVGEQWLGLVTGQASALLEMDESDIRQITSLTDQAAAVLQSQRLLERSRARARREQALREITARVRGFTDPDAIVRTAVRELGAALDRPTFVRLGSAERLSRSPTGESDSDDGQG